MAEILIIIFIILNAGDTFISMYALKRGMHEKNPLLYFIIHHTGLLGFLLIKVAIILVLVFFASAFSLDSLVILNIVYAMIVLNNYLKLYMYRSRQ